VDVLVVVVEWEDINMAPITKKHVENQEENQKANQKANQKVEAKVLQEVLDVKDVKDVKDVNVKSIYHKRLYS